MTGPDEAAPVELGRLLHDHIVATGELPTPIQLRARVLDATRKRGATTVSAFLPGDVQPDDRSLIIDTLYDEEVGDATDPAPLLDCDSSVVLVSTSVVEAGVDISFDTVFRDYAPIPNIVQSGGRCNRSFSGTTGDVVVWRLAAPEDGTGLPSRVIHGSDGGEALPLLQETGRVLRRHATGDGSIDESTMVSDTVADFYESLFEGLLEPSDEHLAAAVKSAAMSELKGEHMIDEIEASEDVIACLTDEERELAEEIREAHRTHDFETLGQRLDETKPLRVSVPYYREDSETANAIRKLDPILGREEGLWLLDTRDRGSFFDTTTGFVVPKSTVEHQFL